MKKTRKGFTLIEILIVIAVIGILGSVMMISSSSAVNSAKASAIVSNLQNLKLAAIAWYGDHLDEVEKLTDTNTLNTKKDDITEYLNANSGGLANYAFVGDNSEGSWYVYYDGADLTLGVSEKLEGRAQTAGLYKDNKSHASENKYSAAAKAPVYMFIR